VKAIPVGKLSTSFTIDCNNCGSSYPANRWEEHEAAVTEDASWDDWMDAYILGDTREVRYIECPQCSFKWMFDWRNFSITDRDAVENAAIDTAGGSNWECSECSEEYSAKSDADECCS
jgi:DNA-directed RNA polymerase subunit M/transcription elongation factor TFIIS